MSDYSQDMIELWEETLEEEAWYPRNLLEHALSALYRQLNETQKQKLLDWVENGRLPVLDELGELVFGFIQLLRAYPYQPVDHETSAMMLVPTFMGAWLPAVYKNRLKEEVYGEHERKLVSKVQRENKDG